MALIKCPDCGKDVSSRATACPFCGCPIVSISESGTIKIKLCKIGVVQKVEISSKNGILWKGSSDQVATFDLSEPTEITVKYHTNMWAFGNTFEYLLDPSKGKKYALTKVNNFGSRPKFGISFVDNIDSE